MTFKLGRLPRDTSRYAPTLEDYFRTHPRSTLSGLEKVSDAEDVDRASDVTQWPMYANDRYGDCTFAEMGHAYTATGVYALKPQVLFSDTAILKGYSDVSGFDPATGANDYGCQMQDVLKYNHDVGLVDVSGNVRKVLMYASLGAPSDPTLLSRTLKTFGYVYIGIDCPASAQDNFGGIWTYTEGSPVIGGHCIGLHRRKPYGSRVGVFDMATWGALQPTTLSFIAHYVTEAWAVITQDWIEANGSSCDGVALAQLEADMKFV